jgi:hypothetical protein
LQQARIWQALFQGLYAVARFDPDAEDYRILSMGDGYKVYDRQFGYRSEGQTFRQSHDKTYGAWVADGLRVQRSRGIAPRVELCNAHIAFPGRETRRYAFERLVLPLSGSDTILTASHIR